MRERSHYNRRGDSVLLPVERGGTAVANGFSRGALAVVLVILGGPAVVAADRVQAGNWQTTMTPPAGSPAVTTHCMTASEAKLMNGDAASLRKYVDESTAKKTAGRCAVKSMEVQDNRTAVTIACGKTQVTSTTIYHGDHYEASSSNGTKITGKRIGACQ